MVDFFGLKMKMMKSTQEAIPEGTSYWGSVTRIKNYKDTEKM